jgi:hypothetical protein
MNAKYGDVVHYDWGYGNGEKMHSTAFVVAGGRQLGYFTILPLTDTHVNLAMTAPIVVKAAYAYKHCDARCPFNPDYEGDPS